VSAFATDQPNTRVSEARLCSGCRTATALTIPRQCILFLQDGQIERQTISPELGWPDAQLDGPPNPISELNPRYNLEPDPSLALAPALILIPTRTLTFSSVRKGARRSASV